MHLGEIVADRDIRSRRVEVFADEVGDGDDISRGGCPGHHVHLAEGDVEGFDVPEEVGGAVVGDGAVLERANALFACHDVLGDAVGAGVLEELVRGEVEEDVVGAVCSMAVSSC